MTPPREPLLPGPARLTAGYADRLGRLEACAGRARLLLTYTRTAEARSALREAEVHLELLLRWLDARLEVEDETPLCTGDGEGAKVLAFPPPAEE